MHERNYKRFSKELTTVALRVQLYHWISMFCASLKNPLISVPWCHQYYNHSIQDLQSTEGAINGT